MGTRRWGSLWLASKAAATLAHPRGKGAGRGPAIRRRETIALRRDHARAQDVGSGRRILQANRSMVAMDRAALRKYSSRRHRQGARRKNPDREIQGILGEGIARFPAQCARAALV